MKRIAVFCVTYNSDKELEHYQASLQRAAERAGDKVKLDISVARNTEEDNPGYFGGIKRLMADLDLSVYDYCILSNVDLTIEEDFFEKLAVYDCAEDTGWIAPQIWSEQEKRDLNPKIQSRYSQKKLQALKILHRYPLLHDLYSKTLYHRNRKPMQHSGNIYAGHGSFIILTKAYISRCGIIDYPIFLFCEEIYLAEQCLRADLKVRHEPSLRIKDNEHVSTGKMHIREYSRLNYEAVSYILHRFYS